MSTTPIRLGELFEQLIQRNLLPAQSERPLPADLSGAGDAESSPWYIKALVGIAAWISAIFLGTFFGAAGLIDSEESMLIWGAILTVAAIVLKRLVSRSIFWGQLAFAVVLAGQGLLVGGFAWQQQESTVIALFVIALEVAIFVLYPDALHRMLSVFAITGAVAFVLYDQEWTELIHGLVLLAS
jgi:hypothetical protein